jgi:hypothetical protein
MPALCVRASNRLDFLWGYPHVGPHVAIVEAHVTYSFDVDHTHGRAGAGWDNSYRFGNVQTRHGRGRAAVNRVHRYLKSMIDKIADAKVRRMCRELELRGIRFDPEKDNWVTPTRRLTLGGREAR